MRCRVGLLLAAIALIGIGLLTDAHLVCDHHDHGFMDDCFLCLHFMSAWASLEDVWTAPTLVSQRALLVAADPLVRSLAPTQTACRAPPGPSA